MKRKKKQILKSYNNHLKLSKEASNNNLRKKLKKNQQKKLKVWLWMEKNHRIKLQDGDGLGDNYLKSKLQ